MVADDFEMPGVEQHRAGVGEYVGRGIELLYAGGLTTGGVLISMVPLGAIVGIPMTLVGAGIGVNALRARR